METIALFIDGANLYATSKSLGFDIDYRQLLKEYGSRGYLVRAFTTRRLSRIRSTPPFARSSIGWITTATPWSPSR